MDEIYIAFVDGNVKLLLWFIGTSSAFFQNGVCGAGTDAYATYARVNLE